MVLTKIDINKLDYKALGLMCGLELHQQLDTNKLFCNCRSILIKDDTKPDFSVSRKLHAVTSEAGEIDATASHEQKRDKTFIYKGFNSCNCLVEIDCQPPHQPNKDSLVISMIISKLTNSTIVDKTYVMRKQVIDGSNVSGFQRTMMISTNGYIDLDFGRVRINKILLEEDAARPIERGETEVIYSLDRLGTPMIEVVAWHDIYTPEDVKKTTMFLGQLFRSTGKTKRGLGSIRQDINISIKNGARTEIKGAQDLELIPEIVKREIVRQLSLLQVREELKLRGINDIYIHEIDITDIFKSSESKMIKEAISQGKKIFCFPLPKFKGILGYEVQPDRRVGTEIANILKTKTTLKGLFHADELPNYGITEIDVTNIKAKLSLKEEDSFIMVISSELEINYVKEIIENRLNQFTFGVPEETRMVTPVGNTEYQRPISGSARMYPETDISPIEFTPELINRMNKETPLSLEARKKLYLENYKISVQLADKMLLSNFAPIFEHIVTTYNFNPTTLCVFLLEDLTKLQREKKINLDYLEDEDIYSFFSNKEVNEIPKSKFNDIFIEYINTKKPIIDILTKHGVSSSKENIDVDSLAIEVIIENKDIILKQRERSIGLLMGRLMAKTKGTIDGKILSESLNKSLNKFLNENK
ncbi:MAG: Glu-tRNA(Gln) amidotransferase subunit GatE [archaeon]